MKKMPEINLKKFKPDFSGYKYAISFVGSPCDENVLNVLCGLVKVFKGKLNIFCEENDFLKSIMKIKQNDLLDDEYLAIYSKCKKDFSDGENPAKIYTSSKINLNINQSEKTSKNLQLFEILASGGFAITNKTQDLKKYFEISKQIEAYNNTEDLIDKIEFYLKNLNIAQKMALLGRFEVIKNSKM